jgi:hypothetical protein
MRMLKTGISFAIVLAWTASFAGAQVVATREQIQISPGGADMLQIPGLGGPRQFKTGTGRIRGRVMAVEGGGPIRRAQVRISGPEVAPKAALTDAEGRYEFRDLPAGRFTLSASKSGFVNVQYGQSRPFESGKPIELADKQALDNADISMPRGGVIAGRIVDEFGDAIPDVSVTAMRQNWMNGRRRLTPSPSRVAQTNDLGQYRIYGLPPGDYYITATMRGGGPLELAAAIDLEVMMAGGTAAGAGPTASAPKSGYASTFYPGTANPADAQKITLAVGQENQNTDFPLLPVRLAKVSGIVVNSEGKPAEGVMLSLAPAARTEMGFPIGLGSARSGKDGAFTINNVTPGDYNLQARGMQVFTSNQGNATMVFRTDGGGESEFGSVPVTVAGEDIPNVLLTTSKGATATGKVTFEGGSRPANATAIRLTTFPVDPDMGLPIGGGPGTVKEDGTFELKGLSGTRLIRLAGAPQGWIVKSVRAGGDDVTDTGVDFKPGEAMTGIEVTLTSRTTSITGGVTSSDGTALKDYTVVIFSESPEHWRMPMTRWVSGTRPNQEGRFQVQNLPAGQYYAIAVDYLPQGEWGDPELLERLKSRAKRFSLDEGATQTLDLKLTSDY